ncbi:hypothetical protein Baya_15560 [Bagarius yarrelli]|uniref:Uncharacterized protein n=1 Tax=Bagarius yarrelli TaxID=175774 RepID=A0A556VC05_BAGYA|nr:hypothetical protein Baya_15560 [Bagarius yarrelli]
MTPRFCSIHQRSERRGSSSSRILYQTPLGIPVLIIKRLFRSILRSVSLSQHIASCESSHAAVTVTKSNRRRCLFTASHPLQTFQKDYGKKRDEAAAP